tara:strand:+ start:6910 stop:7509 length:600 start_codon:yes stop_codon:yes gene_type:complete
MKNRRKKMADIESILESKKSQDSWYDPKQDFSGPMPEGEYKAHVKSLNIKRNKIVKGKFLSDIYEVAFTVADENKDMEYQNDKGEPLSGETFVGRDIHSKGFFRFKKPSKSEYPNLSENMGSNRSYMEFVTSFGLTMEEVDGKFYLPELDLSDIEGLPVIAKLYHDAWTDNDGKERITPRVSQVFNWQDGDKKEEELPF